METRVESRLRKSVKLVGALLLSVFLYLIFLIFIIFFLITSDLGILSHGHPPLTLWMAIFSGMVAIIGPFVFTLLMFFVGFIDRLTLGKKVIILTMCAIPWTLFAWASTTILGIVFVYSALWCLVFVGIKSGVEKVTHVSILRSWEHGFLKLWGWTVLLVVLLSLVSASFIEVMDIQYPRY